MHSGPPTANERAILAQHLAALRPPAASQDCIRRQACDTPAPLSVSQEEIWRLAQQPDLPPVFNESITIHRHGPLQVEALEWALGEIIRRHEAWRTSFDVFDGRPVQMVHPPFSIPLPIEDLRAAPPAERWAHAVEAATENARRPIDLRRGPLVRAKLIRLADDEYRLFLTVHLIVLDGVSVYHVLLPELRTLYDSFAAGRPSPLPELPVQVSDFARWQRAWLASGRAEEQIAYWRKRLAKREARGAGPLQWPAGPRPPKQSFRGEIEPFTLSGEVAGCVRELSRGAGVTIFAALTTVFASLLHSYTSQEEITIGTFSPSGRKRSEVKGLLGYFLNPVPLRITVDPRGSFQQLLRQVREVSAEALSNDDVSFEQIVAALRPPSDPGRNPYFQVAISHDPPLAEPGSEWDVSPMDVNSGGARWALYLAFDVRDDRALVRAQYNPDLFDHQAIRRLVRDFSELLRAASAAPRQSVRELISGCGIGIAA
jgi:hypothetical protein